MPNHKTTFLYVALILTSLIACETVPSPSVEPETDPAQDEAAFLATLESHLAAVSNKDLATLGSTLSPENKMQLILPGSEVMHSADSFLRFHEAWFQDTTWTFDTKILSAEVGRHYGLAVTEVVYREPERDGEPYFNRMIVTYGLEKLENQWYIIMDHASSVEKSTDSQ